MGLETPGPFAPFGMHDRDAGSAHRVVCSYRSASIYLRRHALNDSAGAWAVVRLRFVRPTEAGDTMMASQNRSVHLTIGTAVVAWSGVGEDPVPSESERGDLSLNPPPG